MAEIQLHNEELTLQSFEDNKDLILHLYLDKGHSLKRTRNEVKRGTGFVATLGQYKHAFRRWGSHPKNLKSTDVKSMTAIKKERAELGKKTEFMIHGRRVDPDRLARSMKRYDRQFKEATTPEEPESYLEWKTIPESEGANEASDPKSPDEEIHISDPLEHFFPDLFDDLSQKLVYPSNLDDDLIFEINSVCGDDEESNNPRTSCQGDNAHRTDCHQSDLDPSPGKHAVPDSRPLSELCSAFEESSSDSAVTESSCRVQDNRDHDKEGLPVDLGTLTGYCDPSADR